MSKKIDRTGEVTRNNYGSVLKILEYNSNSNIKIEVSNEHGIFVKNGTYSNFKKGSIYSPYDKSTYGIGYIGEGEFKVCHNGEITKEYRAWHGMMHRCYDVKYMCEFPTYENKHVCEEWHNFQNFAKWYDENYYSINDDKMQVDKDILNKNNNIYSPDKCVFVNNHINSLLLSCKSKRGDYLIGVYFNKRNNKFSSQCRNSLTNKRVGLGLFDNETDAFYAYKRYKENHIKEVADYYKDCIPTILYDALYTYTVEETD